MMYRANRCKHGIVFGHCEDSFCSGYRGRIGKSKLESRSARISDDLCTCRYCQRRVPKAKLGDNGICIGGCAERRNWGPNFVESSEERTEPWD